MRRVIAILAAVGLLTAAGCGGDGKSAPSAPGSRSTAAGTPALGGAEYGRRAAVATAAFGDAGRRLAAEIGRRTPPRRAAAALERFRARVVGAARTLGGLHPPAAVAAAHRRLVTALTDIARACAPSIAAGRAGRTARFRVALRGLRARLRGALERRAQAAAREIDSTLRRT